MEERTRIVSGIDLQPDIDAGYISRVKHPTADLFIHNYTARAQWEKHWTPATLMCRGLILNGRDEIVARPFPKFFNYEEVADRIPAEPFEVFDKLDGSLGILYWTNEGPAIATRGSFTSPQAVEATKILRQHDVSEFALWSRGGWTVLFEILFPQNRIVVDYGTRRELVLLAAIDNDHGGDMAYEGGIANSGWPHIVKRFDGLTDIDAIKAAHRDNAEGFVLRFASGFRCKVKLAEYVRLHKLLTGITPRHVWEELKAGRGMASIVERVPDEFFNWMMGIEAGLWQKYETIEAECRRLHRSDFPNRRTAAAYITKQKYPSILFAMLDGKPYADAIWKMIRPESARAFRCDDMAAIGGAA